MKKIIVDCILAVLSLLAMWVLLYGGITFTSEFGKWLEIDGSILAFIIFGISISRVCAYLDPEEEDDF